jgi:O-antigen ligase
MPLKQFLQSTYYRMLCSVAFFIPIAFNLTSLSIVLLTICWVFQVKKEYFVSFRERKVLWVWLAFFLLHVAGYFYSTNKDQALFDLQTKLSFLLLPFVIGSGPEIKEKNLENIFTALVAGCSLGAIYCLFRSVYIYFTVHTTTQFFYHTLVKDFDSNAVYYSFYVFLALAMLMLYKWTNILARKKLRFPLIGLLFLFLILLSSKTFLALFVLIVIPLYYRNVLKGKVSRSVLVFGLAGMLVLACVIAFTNNPVSKRFERVVEHPELKLVQNQNQQFNNLTLRLFLWEMAIDDMNQNHLWLTGCGIGDVAIMQQKTIMAYNAQAHSLDKHPPLWNFNLHNTYLQVLLMTGLPGLAILLLMVFLPFFMLRNSPNAPFFLVFHIGAATLMVAEAALQTEAGIVVYAFFAMVFYNVYYRDKTSRKSSASPV